MKVSNLEEVLQRMDPAYLRLLETLWQKNKAELLYKYKTSEEKVQTIQYEHLPLIHDQIFGVYEPFVIKSLFSPDTKAAKLFAVRELHAQFVEHQAVLTKYVNPIVKLIVRLLPEKHLEVVLLLGHILAIPGIANIINLQGLLQVLLPQLGDSEVPYRQQVRDCFRKLNCAARGVVECYTRKLNEIDRNQEE
jgi:hypothetical protein